MIIRPLPPKVDPSVSTMMEEQKDTIQWSDIGGLNDQIREIREVIFIFYVCNRLLNFR